MIDVDLEMGAEGGGVDKLVAGPLGALHREGVRVGTFDTSDRDQSSRLVEIQLHVSRILECLEGLGIENENPVLVYRHAYLVPRCPVRPALKFYKVSYHSIIPPMQHGSTDTTERASEKYARFDLVQSQTSACSSEPAK